MTIRTEQETLRIALSGHTPATPPDTGSPEVRDEPESGQDEPEAGQVTPDEPMTEADLEEVIQRLADYLEQVEERTREDALNRQREADEARELRQMLRSLATE